MIRKLHIKNFKSHLDTCLDTAPLTILTGLNGMGKSSVIQSLLLLRQSFQKGMMKGLILNGDLCKIGSAQDAITTSSEEDFIDFNIAFNNTALHHKYKVETNKLDSDLLPEIERSAEDIIHKPNISLFNSRFQYISAHRNALAEKPENTGYYVDTLNQVSGIEGRAEYVAPYINKYGNLPIPIPVLRHPNEENPALKIQIEAWLREFSPNINLHIERVDTNSYKAEYSFNREDGRITPKFKPQNVGFGITYDLPLLAAILSAKPDDLIIIENPESHIHPLGQATIIHLIAKAAQAGVQFILETHSDHIINGALVSVKKGDIHHKNVSAYYFDRDENKHTSIALPIDIKETGRIYKPPKGFFEQIKIDMQYLMGF